MQHKLFCSVFRSAPLEFHWRTCCLCGKHLKHLNSASTHWSTPDGVNTCWRTLLAWTLEETVNDILSPTTSSVTKYFGSPCTASQFSFAGLVCNSRMHEALEWTWKHFQSDVQGVVVARQMTWSGGRPTNSSVTWTPSQQTNNNAPIHDHCLQHSVTWTVNTHQQTSNHVLAISWRVYPIPN